jgi:hypothetical protein
MTDYVQTAEAALTDLCHDVLVGATSRSPAG